MNWRIYKTFTFFFPLLFAISSNAQSEKQEFEAFKTKYNNESFQYSIEEKLPMEKTKMDFSWMDRLFELLPKINWEYVMYGFIGLIILLVLLKLYRNGMIFQFKAKHQVESSDDHFQFIEENLLAIDLNQLLTKAKTEEDYRLAIRYYHYLNTQNLAQKEYITWDPKKTNQQLAQQIKKVDIKTLFEQNTSIFNRVWFGNTAITAELFYEFEQQFNQLNEKL